MLRELDILIALLPYAAIFVAVVGSVHGVAALLSANGRLRRLIPASASDGAATSVRRRGSALEQFAANSLGSKFAPKDDRERTSLNLRLVQAGYDTPQAAQAYYGIRAILALGLAAVALIVMPLLEPGNGRLLAATAMLAAVLGFMVPVVVVSRRRSNRQRSVREGLADVLDLLLVCTEAGLGLDMAISRVGEELASTQPILAEHLRLISSQLLAGRPRAEAMRSFAARTGVEQVNSLVNLLVQSDLLGTSMAQALRTFAADLRAHQLLGAEELAQKVTVKMSMVLVGCFTPALVIVIMAPVIFNIVSTWKGLPL